MDFLKLTDAQLNALLSNQMFNMKVRLDEAPD